MAGRTLYVGGLDEAVTLDTLRAAFLPFGELKDVQLPLDLHTQKSKGFGFVEFESDEDATAAIENMDGAELFGRVIRVNASRALKGKGGKAVWAEADEWLEHIKAGGGADAGDDLGPSSAASRGGGAGVGGAPATSAGGAGGR